MPETLLPETLFPEMLVETERGLGRLGDVAGEEFFDETDTDTGLAALEVGEDEVEEMEVGLVALVGEVIGALDGFAVEVLDVREAMDDDLDVAGGTAELERADALGIGALERDVDAREIVGLVGETGCLFGGGIAAACAEMF